MLQGQYSVTLTHVHNQHSSDYYTIDNAKSQITVDRYDILLFIIAFLEDPFEALTKYGLVN